MSLEGLHAKAQDFSDQYTRHTEQMFGKTHTRFSPWIIVRADDKKAARL